MILLFNSFENIITSNLKLFSSNPKGSTTKYDIGSTIATIFKTCRNFKHKLNWIGFLLLIINYVPGLYAPLIIRIVNYVAFTKSQKELRHNYCYKFQNLHKFQAHSEQNWFLIINYVRTFLKISKRTMVKRVFGS